MKKMKKIPAMIWQVFFAFFYSYLVIKTAVCSSKNSSKCWWIFFRNFRFWQKTYVLDFDVTCSAAVEKKDRSDMIKFKLVFSLTLRWNKEVNTFYIMFAFALHTYILQSTDLLDFVINFEWDSVCLALLKQCWVSAESAKVRFQSYKE